MKRFGNLYEKICDLDNLKKAHAAAKKGKGFYREVKMVDEKPEFYLGKIRQMLLNHSYKVSKYSTKCINDKGKVRILHKLPYYPDRIIHHAIMQVIEFVFEKTFCYHTCASLSGRGIKRASILTKRYASLSGGKGAFCLKIDIEKFYENINHEILKDFLAKKFKDKELLGLFNEIITNYPETKGLPIGSYLSQFLANFYLNNFDHWLKENKGQKYIVRFMDDVCIFGDSKAKLHELLRQIKAYIYFNLKLNLKQNYQIFPTNIRGVDFVGFRFFKHFVLLRKSNALRCKRILRAVLIRQEKKELISNRLFCGVNSYAGFFKACNGWRFVKRHFLPLLPSLASFYLARICAKNNHFERQKSVLNYAKKTFKGHFINNASFKYQKTA